MGNMRPILLGLAACFCLLILWAIFHPQPHLQTAKARADGPWKVFQAIPAGLVVMTFLITGVEASVSGWLATYTHRSSHRLAATIAAPTCLWAGLLLSRLFWSLCEPSSGRGYVRVVRGSLLLILASSILLVASSRSLTVLIASLFLGLGIGPTYPLLLAWALRFRRGGAIFFVAGLGAACLPWLTGIVSTWRGSLQIGLAVPIGAAASLLLLSLVSRLQRWSEHPIDFD